MGVLDNVLSPSGGPLFDLSILGLGTEQKTTFNPENMTIETLNLYMPKDPNTTETLVGGFGNIIGEVAPWLFMLMIMNMMMGQQGD